MKLEHFGHNTASTVTRAIESASNAGSILYVLVLEPEDLAGMFRYWKDIVCDNLLARGHPIQFIADSYPPSSWANVVSDFVACQGNWEVRRNERHILDEPIDTLPCPVLSLRALPR